MSTFKETLDKIKSLRIQNGISQTKMAKELGMSQPGYAKIEIGGTETIPLSVAVSIAKVLNVGFNELFDIDGDSQKIDALNNLITEYRERIEELKEKIELLKSEKEHIKAHLVMQMVSSYSFEIGVADHRLIGVEDELKKGERLQLISAIENSFNRNKDYYINTGFLSQSDFDNHYKEMRGMYEFFPDDKANPETGEMPL